jgi:glucose-1-phosphate cytidylyltransferase
MQLVILAGGRGTRISEESFLKPKPLIEIGNMPIIWHIMKYYSFFGINNFIICGGYKCDLLKDFFFDYLNYQSDIEINFKKNFKKNLSKNKLSWKVTIADTGLETMTGGRIKRIQKYIKGNSFCLTYGDGLSNVNLKKLINFHKKHKKLATVTAVQPKGKFGAIKLENDYVKNFNEKPQGDGYWKNGGFFVLRKEIFSYITNDSTIWEEDPLKNLSKKKQLKVFKHNDFWQPMDTLNDKIILENLWKSEKAPWKIWND